MTKLSTSPDRGNFHIECELKSVDEGRKTMEKAQEIIEFYQSWKDRDEQREADPEWQKNNMEFDLRSAGWVVAKVRASEAYAQNLYAAMCNRDFVKNDVWPLLKDQRWSCSWRYAGGIVAHMVGKGDYIDWYCSGIRDADSPDIGFVGEGHVTDEIREDLLTLGWIVVDDGLDE